MPNRLSNLIANRHDRVQAGRGLLKDHRHATPANGLHLLLSQSKDIFAGQSHLARSNKGVLREQPQQRHRSH
jgi:hypothetical protein